MNIRRIEHELFLYRIADIELADIKAELNELKSYDKPKTGRGRKADVPEIANQLIARDLRRDELERKVETIKNRKKAVEAAFEKFKGHEYTDAVKRIYIDGQSVRIVAKDMRRDWRTVDRHARLLLGKIGAAF